MITFKDVTNVYQMGDIEVHALRGVSLEIRSTDMVAIMGPSGSGKSTLMNIIGCLDQPTGGSYGLDGDEVSALSDDQLAEVRGKKIGFVFQNFNLLPRMSAVEQVEVPLIYSGAPNRRERTVAALESVGLADRMHHKPTELSGGQQQRVAIARAIVTDPAIILADEPTGALDTKTSREIMNTFRQLNEDRGLTTIFVTHEHDVAHSTKRIVELRDGLIVADEIVDQGRVAAQAGTVGG